MTGQLALSAVLMTSSKGAPADASAGAYASDVVVQALLAADHPPGGLAGAAVQAGLEALVGAEVLAAQSRDGVDVVGHLVREDIVEDEAEVLLVIDDGRRPHLRVSLGLLERADDVLLGELGAETFVELLDQLRQQRLLRLLRTARAVAEALHRRRPLGGEGDVVLAGLLHPHVAEV